MVNGSESLSSFKQAIYFNSIGFNLDDTIIYKKRNFAFPSKTRYHQTFEYIFVLSKDRSPVTFNAIKDRQNIYVGQKSHGKNRTKDGWQQNKGGETRDEMGMRHNVWEYVTGGGHVSQEKVAHEHPAIFPFKLACDIIYS